MAIHAIIRIDYYGVEVLRMGAQNKVIAGDYIGKMTGVSLGQLYIATSFGKPMYLNKQNIEAYELITDEQRKSAASGVIRGAVGATLLGPVGLLAGLSAKNKGIYTVAIKFKDGKTLGCAQISDELKPKVINIEEKHPIKRIEL